MLKDFIVKSLVAPQFGAIDKVLILSQFLYHFRPKHMQGHVLFPLNALKEALPEIYSYQAEKYKGRERLLEKKIPILDCLWNDVIHLSPIHPQIILDCFRKEGLYDYAGGHGRELEVFKIPSTHIEEQNTVCFQSGNFDFTNYDPKRDKFWRFKRDQYEEQLEVHADQIRVWLSDKAAERKLFWFSHTTHILTKQVLDIRSCEIVLCK